MKIVMCHVKCLVKLSPPPSPSNLIFLKQAVQKASVQLLVCYLNWNGISPCLYFLVALLLPASLSPGSKFWTLRLLDDLCCGVGKLTFICCIFWICAGVWFIFRCSWLWIRVDIFRFFLGYHWE